MGLTCQQDVNECELGLDGCDSEPEACVNRSGTYECHCPISGYTGDGIGTALNVVRVMADTGRELADLASQLVTYPQVLVNVRVREKRDLRSVPEVAAVMSAVEQRLSGQGRLLVRYSGTEPLLRVMLEGRDQREIQGWAAEIAGAVKAHLG